MTENERQGAGMASMYEAMLTCAIRQKEAAERGDMEAFEREALRRGHLASQIDEVLPRILADRARSRDAIDEARAIALRIEEVDSKSLRLIEEGRAELMLALSRLSSERQCIAAYGSVIGFNDKDAGFVDRLK